tara:strand:+ start:149 stop:376 length:228 start_codon:yes stop_codon:yes gene_type:complete
MTKVQASSASNALDKVIEIIGSQSALARKLKLQQPSINSWKLRGKIPAEKCLMIERIVKGAVTRYEMRPDVFGKE